MKKIAFSLVSILTALLISITLLSCGGGGGGGGGGSSGGSGSSGIIAGEQGEPSGASSYGSSYEYPAGFYTRADDSVVGALWVFLNNPSTALYIKDATHAYHCVRSDTSSVWTPTIAYEIQITNGGNGYIRFSNPSMSPARYAYNITNTDLTISNTFHGTKSYRKMAYQPSNPSEQYVILF